MGRSEELDYVLTKRLYRWLLNCKQKEELCCFRCGKVISVGDLIHRNTANFYDGRVRIYHAKCYEEMFIEC